MSFKNLKKNIYQGYVQLTEFNNIYLPTPIQNLIMKNFCDQNNAIFKLSVNEHYIKNCYMELFFILKNSIFTPHRNEYYTNERYFNHK